MRIPPESRLLLVAASIFVPKRSRADWLREWRAEAWWWVNSAPDAGFIGVRLRLALHCAGAFRDARCVRSQSVEQRAGFLSSPGACLAALALLISLVGAATGGFAVTRRALQAAPPGRFFSDANLKGAPAQAGQRPYAEAERLAILSQTGPFMGLRMGLPEDRLELWGVRAQSIEGIATYVPRQGAVATPTGERRVAVAEVGPGFFDLLGVRAALGIMPSEDATVPCPECAVVSHQFWRTRMNGDPAAPGRSVSVDGRRFRVVGVLPQGFRFLSPEPAVWIIGSLQAGRLTTAVCRLKAGVSPKAAEGELRDLARFAGGSRGIWVTVTPMEATQAGPVPVLATVWLGFLAACCLVAAAGRRSRLRYRAFLSAKFVLSTTALLLAGIEFGGLLTDIQPGDGLLAAGALSLWLFVAAPCFALWWSWADQRNRCRECLARLAMPAEMGHGARLLFEASGTELVCPKGHGRLFVSQGPRPYREWAPLDATWRDLFAPAVKT